MSYCPNCGKKSSNEYASFCGFCGANMKDLGAKVVVAAAPTPPPTRTYTPEPQMHSYEQTASLSRIERLRREREEQRIKARSAATDFGPPEEETPSDGSPVQVNQDRSPYDGVNIQVSPDYDRLLANGLAVECDDSGANTEKMQFSLPS